MRTLPPVDTDHLVTSLVELLNIPSPTGFTEKAMAHLADRLGAYPNLSVRHTPKGVLVATWPGTGNGPPRALTAHVDTLGAMVKEIKSSGRLKLTRLGGYAWTAVEGEGCTVFTSGGETLRGSILLENPSAHVNAKVATMERSEDTLEVRLDARTASQSDTEALGIQVGDYVAFDPRVEQVNGFVRSRHLDDKACVACLLAAIRALDQAGLQPVADTVFHFSNYEEVGHGAATGIPETATELVTVDMAAIGPGQTSDEYHATLCVKDGRGPYHHGLSQRLRKLADRYEISYKVDIYPYYGSDGEAYWRAGGDVAVALIGPGVDASHSYERTHLDALKATTQWILAYLLEDPTAY